MRNRRLCAGCTDSGRIGRNTMGLQELCVCIMRRNGNTDEWQHVGQTVTSDKYHHDRVVSEGRCVVPAL